MCSLKYLPLKFTYASVSLCKCEHFGLQFNTVPLKCRSHSSYLFCLHCFVIVIVHKSGVLGIMSYCIFRHNSR